MPISLWHSCLVCFSFLWLKTPVSQPVTYLPVSIAEPVDSTQGLTYPVIVTPTAYEIPKAVVMEPTQQNIYQHVDTVLQANLVPYSWGVSPTPIILPTQGSPEVTPEFPIFVAEQYQPSQQVEIWVAPTETPGQAVQPTIAAINPTYSEIKPLKCDPNGQNCEYVISAFKECPEKDSLHFPNDVEDLYAMMLANDGKICYYNMVPMCKELMTSYIDWDLIKMMPLPDDEEYDNVIAYTQDLKRVSATRGIFLNIDDNSIIRIDESVIFEILMDAHNAQETCSDPEGRPVIYKVDRFVTALNSFVMPIP